MTFPTPPPDNSGGFMVIQYANAIDSHRMRLHFRPIGTDPTFSAPSCTAHTTVMSEYTAFVTLIKGLWTTNWTFSLKSIFKNNGDGTFTELFGWAQPADIAGTSTGTDAAYQNRAGEAIMSLKTSFGGRARIIQIATANRDYSLAGTVVSGNPSGTIEEQLVDYLTTASKTNLVAHDGHVMVNPGHFTLVINRRLRRHYGFA